MSKPFKILLGALLSISLLLIGFLIFASLTDYRPEEKILLGKFDNPDTIHAGVNYKMFDWNIGYGGLSQQFDFFYDGGKMVRPDRESLEYNMFETHKALQAADSVDFILLQEADVKAKRTYRINQFEFLNERLPDFFPFFAPNYKVRFVPSPLLTPMGAVHTGLLTMSKKLPSETFRVAFPGNYSWPFALFMPDRCFIISRYPIASGNEFVLINVHNSAYDDGNLRKMQMDYLKQFLLKEYAKNNKVLVCGDWNQCPPNFKAQYANDVLDTLNKMDIEENFPDLGWRFYFDASVPSNRRVDKPYTMGESLTTTIDFCLASPGIAVHEVKVQDDRFQLSDHNPVYINFEIIP